ncbi:MAG: VOC family protein [Saprospiraceae bacterium]|nr:VOC family protein [Saprospiraceae bacterium]
MENHFIQGGFNWADLTVPNADELRNFYSTVIGYSHTAIEMGGYEDYCMNSPVDGLTKTGICHAKGVNGNLPPVWLIYFNVKNLEESLEQVIALGGKIISPARSYGPGASYAVIQDPGGAYCALYQPS